MAFAWSRGPGVRLQHPGAHRPVRLVGLGRQRLRRPRGGRQVGGQPAAATATAAAAAAPSRRPGPGPSDLSASAPPARPRAAGCTAVCVCVRACALCLVSGRGCVSLLLEHVWARHCVSLALKFPLGHRPTLYQLRPPFAMAPNRISRRTFSPKARPGGGPGGAGLGRPPPGTPAAPSGLRLLLGQRPLL